MKERPILFSAPMVRALIDGSKTQTRRALKVRCQEIGERDDGSRWPWSEHPDTADDHWHVCPYGQPGDRLWVRESYRFADVFDGDSPARVGDRCLDAGYSKPWAPIQYDADCARRDWKHTGTPPHNGEPQPGKGRPSIHMPHWASRILLEVTGVRVERLQDISEADADAEGCERLESERYDRDPALCPKCDGLRLHCALGPNGGVIEDVDCVECDTYVKRYRHLWESISGVGSWDANPWVWVVEFRRVTP